MENGNRHQVNQDSLLRVGRYSIDRPQVSLRKDKCIFDEYEGSRKASTPSNNLNLAANMLGNGNSPSSEQRNSQR